MIIKIGDFAIKIKSDSAYLQRLYANYRLPDEVAYDFEVEARPEFIAYLKSIATESMIEDEFESTAILEEVIDNLFKSSTILFHAATVAVDGEVYAFSATSGTGKSTHVRLWLEHFGDRALVVNGDKPFLTLKDDRVWVSGSPWCGKEYWGTNTSLPLKAICFLERGEKNTIRCLDQTEIVGRFFKQIRLAKTSETMEKMMTVIEWIFEHIPFYLLECTISEEAVEVAYQGMQNEGEIGEHK